MFETMQFEDVYIYQCPKCHFLASAGGDINKIHSCPKCKSIMNNTGITKGEWDSKTKEEKIALIKENETLKVPEKNYTDSDSALITGIDNINENIKGMNNNLVIIKNILMFYLVINIIGTIITMLNIL